MSDDSSKCPETIGYVGDVRNLSENRGIAIDDKEIIKWVKHSNGTLYATLFYSSDDVWKVGRQQQKLLKINPDLKFKQVSNIQEFIDYVDNGMDRNEHPVKDITMVNVYSSWEIEEGNRDYVEEARKRHEPEVRQVSREAIEGLADAMFKQTIINIFLSNKEANATKALTDKDVYQRVKDEYGWDQANAVKDQILTTSGTMKSGIDEMKDKSELITKGVKSLPDVKPQTVLIKMGAGLVKHVPILEVYSGFKTMKKVKGLENELYGLDAKKKILDCENPSDMNFKKCINISEQQLDKMKIFIKEERGF